MSEKIGIEINLIGADKAEKTLKEIESTTKRLGAKKTMIQMEDGNLVSVEQRIKDIQDRLAVLKSQKSMGLATKQDVNEMKRLNAELTILNRGLKTGTANARTLGQVFNSISSKAAHIGSAMQSVGNSLSKIGSIFRPITTGLLMGAGYKALNLFTEGLSNTFERADTMKNYDRQLKALGLDVAETFSVAGKEAKTAKENLDDAVQGLPTSLDEIMAAQKVYAGATGEMVNSTKTAIAANNAFLASGMGAREQRFMQKYLVALSSGADLTTTQWQSMERIAPLVMRSVAKELGYAGDAYSQFRDDVEHGRIAGEDFLKAFQEVGISGAVANAARAQTESWNGLFSNIRIAMTRLGANVVETLNQTFKDATGRTLLQRLLGWDAEGKDLGDGIKHWVNSISQGIQDWIKSHPDEIIEFFETLKAVDVKGLLKGLAEGLGDIVKFMGKLARASQKVDLEKWGRWLAKAGFLGKGFTILGGLIKGTRHIWGGAGAGGAWLFGKLGSKGGFFGKIASFFGKKKDIQVAGEAGKAVTNAAPGLISAFKNIALLSGILAMPAVTAWGISAAAKNSIKNFGDTVNLLKDINWDDAKKVLIGVGSFIGGSAILGGIVGKWGIGVGVNVAFGEAIVGIITSIATGFFALDMTFIKTGIDNFVQSVKLLNEIPDVSSFGNVTQKIKDAIDVFNEVSSLLTGRYVDKNVKEGGLQEIGFFTGWNLDRLSNALEHLKKAAENINKLTSISVPPNAANRIGRIIDAVSDIMSKMWKLIGLGFGNISDNVKKVADAMYELRRAIYHINKFETEKINTEGLNGLNDAIEKISEAFSVDAISDIRSQITTFVAAIQDALAEFDKLNEDIEIKAKVKLSKDFETSVDAVVRQIGLAKQRIKLAWAGIPTSLTKTVSLTVNTQYRQTGNGWTRIGESQRAMGGMIYRAKGGSIPMFPGRPRGTDRVPAWLTPGEYVHNKRAVDTFGIDFMRKVNNLDMKGAMNELMHRAGNMASINRGTSITNNHYNNQRVVINNNSAGAGFTFRSASRFVGAF